MRDDMGHDGFSTIRDIEEWVRQTRDALRESRRQMEKAESLLDEITRAAGQLTVECTTRQKELHDAWAEVDDLQRKNDELETT